MAGPWSGQVAVGTQPHVLSAPGPVILELVRPGPAHPGSQHPGVGPSTHRCRFFVVSLPWCVGVGGEWVTRYILGPWAPETP